jgi:[ribosomal protein S18]-alanine N-acetyltransferase
VSMRRPRSRAVSKSRSPAQSRSLSRTRSSAKSPPLTSITLRPARLADANALADLDVACFPAADCFSLRIWRHLLGPAAKRRSAISVIAESGGRAVGSANALLRKGSRVVRLYTLAVHPDARGHGLADRLLAEILKACPRRCDTLSLEVRAANPARALYDRWGLVVSEELPEYYSDGAAGVRMRASVATVRSALR